MVDQNGGPKLWTKMVDQNDGPKGWTKMVDPRAKCTKWLAGLRERWVTPPLLIR